MATELSLFCFGSEDDEDDEDESGSESPNADEQPSTSGGPGSVLPTGASGCPDVLHAGPGGEFCETRDVVVVTLISSLVYAQQF